MTTEPSADKIGAASRAFDAYSGPLTFVRHIGSDDIYIRGESGGALFAIPGLWDSMPDDLLAALRARRRANVTGRCPACDAVVAAAAGVIRHENFCMAQDDCVRPALKAWHRRVGLHARGRRIVEDPA